jgi:DeoR/GlpR family transcriptional regulator of sugar metabolism
MSKRNTPQRRHNILTLLNEQGEVSVDELAKRFETSEVTIRKDLAALESNGLAAASLRRRHHHAPGTGRRSCRNRFLCISAPSPVRRSSCLREHARIIIDSGSTTAAMIPGAGPCSPAWW